MLDVIQYGLGLIRGPNVYPITLTAPYNPLIYPNLTLVPNTNTSIAMIISIYNLTSIPYTPNPLA